MTNANKCSNNCASFVANDCANYFLPAEWAQQSAVIITWPHKNTDWASILDRVEPVFIEISKAICQQQQLIIVANNQTLKQHICQLMAAADVALEQVHFVIANTDDTWARDHGPITLIESTYRDGNEVNHTNKVPKSKLLNFTFNGWGNKFAAKQDNVINLALYHQLSAQGLLQTSVLATFDFVLEGGAIESDGCGHILTTSACLLNPNRNPSFDKVAIDALLKKWFTAKKVLWLDHGELEGDDTDAHIDTLCRFAPDNRLVYVKCDDANDSHFEVLEQMEQQLASFTTSSGQPFELIPLPWPSAKYNQDGERLPATYANYLIINNAILVPTYQDANDSLALAQIAKAYPDRKIVGINCLPIIEQFGSLHCLTMQVPAQVELSATA